MTVALIVLALLLQLDHASPQVRVEGILALPGLFGEYACSRYEPVGVDVFVEPFPDSGRLGVLEVRSPWYPDPEGPCEAIEVVLVPEGGGEDAAVWMREYGYEELGLAVTAVDGDWRRILAGDGVGWVQGEHFHGYEELVLSSLAYLVPGWTGAFWAAPGEGAPVPVPAAWRDEAGQELMVEVLESRVLDGELWFHVRLDPAYSCGDDRGARPVVEGWAPAFLPNGANQLWFYSRGC